MTRAATPIAIAMLTALPVLTLCGCAAWRKKNNESIIHIEASQNPDRAAKLTHVGIAALGKGKIDVAKEKFLAAVDADLAYGPAHNNLGLMHYEQGNLYQAVLAFEQAMEFMPQDPTVLYNLALTLESAGKVYEALDLYMQASEMDPANPFFLGNLVRLRVRMGDHDPSLVAQLQDLVLIETRPDWRRWADHQLAIRFNPILDRGPETPEFDPDEDDEESGRDRNVDDQIIDLSPEKTTSDAESVKPPTNPQFDPKPRSPTLSAPQVEPMPAPLPMPIRDSASVKTFPPSIELNSEEMPEEMDYFR